jgi:hypothetical protein
MVVGWIVDGYVKVFWAKVWIDDNSCS